MKRLIERLLAVGLSLGVLAALAAGGVAYWAWGQIHEPFRGDPRDETVVVVEPGTSAVRILSVLEDEGLIID
ncbi:MAG: hypothetical protein AAFX50_17070, partial [Acidobacteriota bacterium]